MNININKGFQYEIQVRDHIINSLNKQSLFIFEDNESFKGSFVKAVYIGFKSKDEINFDILFDVWNLLADNSSLVWPKKYNTNGTIRLLEPKRYLMWDSSMHYDPMKAYSFIDT